MPNETPLRVLGVAASAQLRALVRETLAAGLPHAEIELAAPEALLPGRPPDADCVVVDVTPDGALETVRRLRAGGFAGGLVLLVEERDPLVAARVGSLGALELVPRTELATALPAAVADVLAAARGAPELEPLRADLRRMQRLLAAGEVALELQHALNNPLTALLAEAQLLEMEPLAEEHAASVKRIVELCRRMTTIVRRLDVVGKKAG